MQNKKWLSMLLALLVSVGLWVYVVTIENPVQEMKLDNIPVTFSGEDLLREDYYLLITDSNADSGVSLTFSGKLSELKKLRDNRAELQVNVNVSHLRNSQTYTLSYDVSDLTLPSAVSAQDLTLSSRDPSMIEISLEKLEKVPVPVKVQNDVSTEEGYTTGRLTQSHSEIYVQGPEEIVRQISYAQVILDRENVNQTITSALPYTLIDVNGEIVESDKVSSDVTEIDVTLPVLMYKDVPLEVALIEGGGVTGADCSVDIEPRTIRLSGEPAVLESVNSVKLSNIDLSSLMTNSEKIAKSIVIPEGCTSISGEQEAEVSVEIRNKAIRQLRVPSTNFQYTGVPADMQVEFKTLMLMVTIRANAEDINEITEDNLRVVADFSTSTLGTNMSGVPVEIYVDGFMGAGVIGTYTISVDVVSVAETKDA